MARNMNYEERQAEIARLKDDESFALSAPLIMDGAISSTQINRMGKREYEAWRVRVQRCLDLRRRIAELARTDGEIASAAKKLREKKRAAIFARHETYCKMISDLGRMSHKVNGKLKPGYERSIALSERQMKEEIGKLDAEIAEEEEK